MYTAISHKEASCIFAHIDHVDLFLLLLLHPFLWRRQGVFMMSHSRHFPIRNKLLRIRKSSALSKRNASLPSSYFCICGQKCDKSNFPLGNYYQSTVGKLRSHHYGFHPIHLFAIRYGAHHHYLYCISSNSSYWKRKKERENATPLPQI